jgi:hypothetical protein
METIMGLVVELSREFEEQLEAEAIRHGVPAREYARRLIERQLPRPKKQAEETRPEPTGFGKFAHLPISSEELCLRKQAEIDMEARDTLKPSRSPAINRP